VRSGSTIKEKSSHAKFSVLVKEHQGCGIVNKQTGGITMQTPSNIFKQLFDATYLRYESDEYKATWSLLRAIEWGQWPLFIAQPIAPLFLLFVSWVNLALTLIALTWVWSLVRYKFISLPLAQFGALFVNVKWLSGIVVCIYFILQQNYKLAAITICWPLITLLLQFLTIPTQIGVLQQEFAYRIIALDSENM
jgi:hypothetical protein